MHKKELARFERVSHILIEEGFGDFFVKTGIIDKLSFTEKISLFFEKKLPLAHRIKAAAKRCGPTFVHFVKYLSSRTDILEPRLCYQLSDIELTQITKREKVTIPKLKIQNKLFEHAKDKPLFFDGFSYRCSIKPKRSPKSTKPHQVHFLEKKIRDKYELDLEILHFFATVVDSQMKISFNAQRVIHEYMAIVHQRFHLKKHMSYAQKLKGALHSKKVTLPEYWKTHSTDQHLVLKPMNGIAADEIPQAILAYHEHNEEMMQNLATLLFSPVLTHGFLITELDLDNIVLQDKGVVGLNHIPELTHLTKVEVATITTFFSGLLTKDAEEILETFAINPKTHSFHSLKSKVNTLLEKHTHLRSKHIEQILETIHAKQKVPTYFFELIQLMHLCEEIQFHFQIRRTILVLLKPHVEKSLQVLAKNHLEHEKKLSKAQKILFSQEQMQKEITALDIKPHRVFMHLSFTGFMIIVILTFILIFNLIQVKVTMHEILIILVACFLLTRMSKHHFILTRHKSVVYKSDTEQ